MPTLAEINAKRKELGVSALEAKKALTGTPTVQNLPVQPTGGATIPVAPQVTPTAPQPTTPTAPVAPTTPPPMGQAPVSPETGLSTPQAPITPPTPATPTATPEQKTVDKTTEIQAKNEAQMALNKQKSELAIADRKKQAEEAKIASTPTDQKSIVQSLISGVSVPPQNTPEYRNAQTIATQFKKYNSMTDTELLSNLRQGNIGSELDSYLQANPNYAAAKQKLAQQQKVDSLNRVGQSIMNVSTGKEPVDLADLTSVEAKYTAPIGTNQQAYLDYVTNNPEVQKTGVELKRIATQISETSTTYNAALKDLQKTYQGKLSASALLTLMGSRTRDTKDLIDSLVNAKTLAQGDFDLAMKMAEGEYGAVTKDLAVQQQLAQEARQQQYARENAVFQANLGLQTKQAEFEQSLAQQAQLATDPISGTNAIIDTFEKMGIMADRSRQEIIADVQAKVASGIPLGQALSELQTAFKSKPQYQKAIELQMGQLSDAQKLKAQQDFSISSDIRNFEQQKEIARINNDYNRQDFLFQLENDPAKRLAMAELEEKLNANKSLFDVLGKNVGTYEGNRGYDLAGKLGDPMPAGGNWEVVSVDQAGELGVPYKAGMKKPYGNTVVMRDENGNEIRYSHLESIGVKPGDKLGFGDIVGTRGNTGNVRGANGETLTAEQLKAGRGAHLDIEIKSGGKLLSQTEQVAWLKSKKAGQTTGLGEKQFTQFNQTKTQFKSEPIVKAFEEALVAGGDIIASLGSENGPGDVGAVFNFMKSLDPTSTVREGEFALAAKSAGVWESFKNIPANKLEGTILTDKQRKDFGKLALKYIESKGKLYDTKYEDMTKVLKQQGVPESYYPTRMTDYVKQYKSEAPGASSTTGTFTGSNGVDYSSYFKK